MVPPHEGPPLHEHTSELLHVSPRWQYWPEHWQIPTIVLMHFPLQALSLEHWQRPFAQLSSCWVSQRFPHPPQFFRSPDTAVSHPSSGVGAAGVLQFPKPGTHDEVQTPAEHAPEPMFFIEQGRPQAPQAVTDVSTWVSHPFVGGPSQCAHPGSQTIPHVPDEHVGVPWLALHTVVQLPQCVISSSWDSQPFAGTPSQS